MIQKYGNSIWYSIEKITQKELRNLDIIESIAINKIINEQQIIYEQVNLSDHFPIVLAYLPLSQN